MNADRSTRFAGVTTAALAGTAFALAGHLGLLRAFGTVLPYRDQWQCTAFDLLEPWLNGTLTWKNFFTPLNDHWPVLTRLLSFALVRVNGQWNNLLETSLNALLFAAGIFLFLRRILPGLRGWARPAFALLTGALGALPITWENTLWGIQSLVYTQILFTLLYLDAVVTETGLRDGAGPLGPPDASLTRARLSRRWWLGHAAGLIVLFTQHSAILAHVAAALLLAWRWWRHDGDRRVALAGLGFAVVVIAAFAAFFPSLTVTAALSADSWQLALHVFLQQLAWPMPHPAWAFLLYAPWLLWCLSRLTARRLASADAFILVLGLWVGAQAAAIGYGRAAETFSFASRYCDFLTLGLLLNAACLARLWLAAPRESVIHYMTLPPALRRLPLGRTALLVLGLVWFIAPLKSFWWETSESHAGYNLSRRVEENRRNLERLQSYFAARDPAVLLADPGTQQELFTYAPSLVRAVSTPAFAALLPPESGAPRARSDHGLFGWVPAILLPAATPLAAAGFLLLGWSMLRVTARGRDGDTEPIEPAALPTRSFPVALGTGAAALLALGAWAAWPQPLTFDADARLRTNITPPRAGVTYTDLEFTRYDGDRHNVVPARGGVQTVPYSVRQFWYGTLLAGDPNFRGVIRSQSFPVSARYLVVPFSGYPCTSGNGLRVRFVDAAGHETWESYVGPDAGTDLNFWTLDAAAHPGAQAAVFLFDGNGGERSWLGVARPAQTDDPRFAAQWRALLRAERAEPTHRALAGLALTLALAAIFLGARARRGITLA